MDVVTNEYLLQRIQGEFSDAIRSAELPYNMLTLVVDPEKILDILKWLKEDDILKFRFLTDICGSHFPNYKDHELCVIYHVQSMENNMRLRLKCFVPVNKPEISSVTSLYSCANWMERETYDYYGFIFTGHPNLKRILNVDEMDYFPLRKEYPLEDATRTDKEDKYFGR